MKKLALSLVLLASYTLAHAQIKALTETGDQVTLYEDGTWAYDDPESVEPPAEIPLNTAEFNKSEDASFLLKSSKDNFGLWLDPKSWSFTKDSSNPEAEYELHLKSGDLYGMMIVEKFEIPLENLRAIAVENAQSAAPDIKIQTEEYRIVNGMKVLHLRMSGTIQGIKFSYFGYYYSNENGTVQLLTFTSQNLMDEMIGESEQLINGLVRLNDDE